MRILVEAKSQQSLDVRIEKANKSLRKAHMTLVQVVSQETKFKTVKIESSLDWIKREQGIQVPYIESVLEIPDAVVKIEGQEVVGRIQETPIGNMVTTIQGEDLPERFRTEAICCDHCRTKRRRKASWIIRRGEDLVQIGDQCSTVYFGVDVDQILSLYEKMSSLGEDEDWGGGFRRQYFEMSVFLNCIAWLVVKGGFISRKVAESYPGGLRSTTDRAQWILWAQIDTTTPSGKKEYEEQCQEREALSKWMEESEANANSYADCLEWWRNLQNERKLDNFEWNVAVAMFNETPKWAGLAAYGMKIFMEKTHPTFKEVDFYRMERGQITNEPLAPEKTRLQFRGLVTDILDYEEYQIVKVQTETGHLVSWFTSGAQDFERGYWILVKATVKSLREYKGMITTQVNRPKILEIFPNGNPR